MTTNVKWHDIREIKPAVGARVLIVRKAMFWDAWYVDIAKWTGNKFEAGSASPKAYYWADLPDAPDVAPEEAKTCPNCGSVMLRRWDRWDVDEDRWEEIEFHCCPNCGYTDRKLW